MTWTRGLASILVLCFLGCLAPYTETREAARGELVLAIGVGGELVEAETDGEGKLLFRSSSSGRLQACEMRSREQELWRMIQSKIAVGDLEVRDKISLDPNRYEGGVTVAFVRSRSSGEFSIWYAPDLATIIEAGDHLRALLQLCTTDITFESPRLVRSPQ